MALKKTYLGQNRLKLNFECKSKNMYLVTTYIKQLYTKLGHEWCRGEAQWTGSSYIDLKVTTQDGFFAKCKAFERLKDISTPDFSTPSFNPRPFNPRIFQPWTFQPQTFQLWNFQPWIFQPTMKFSTLDFSTIAEILTVTDYGHPMKA